MEGREKGERERENRGLARPYRALLHPAASSKRSRARAPPHPTVRPTPRRRRRSRSGLRHCQQRARSTLAPTLARLPWSRYPCGYPTVSFGTRRRATPHLRRTRARTRWAHSASSSMTASTIPFPRKCGSSCLPPTTRMRRPRVRDRTSHGRPPSPVALRLWPCGCGPAAVGRVVWPLNCGLCPGAPPLLCADASDPPPPRPPPLSPLSPLSRQPSAAAADSRRIRGDPTDLRASSVRCRFTHLQRHPPPAASVRSTFHSHRASWKHVSCERRVARIRAAGGRLIGDRRVAH